MTEDKKFFEELTAQARSKRLSKSEFSKIKLKLCEKYKIKRVPTDIDVLMNATDDDLKLLKTHLRAKPSRSVSGVSVVAIMTKPRKCPHGKCTYCPGGPDSFFGNMPQSYTGKEPATMRGMRLGFDSYLQVFNRLEQYVVTGHMPDKVELIIMGGTFPAAPKTYQKNFVKSALNAMNDFSTTFFKNGELDIKKFKTFFELPGMISDKKRLSLIKKKINAIKKKKKSTLESEQKKNETSKIRCVGMTLETRPDYGRTEHGNFALLLGATRIELGIESVYDESLSMIERGHDVAESKHAIADLRDLGYKLNFHYMLGLPGTSKEKDLEGLKKLFTDPDFFPDMLKIYPCMVLKGTEIYKLWKNGSYSPLTTEESADIISEFKKYVPKYVRIMRIQRDIPTNQTDAGVDRTNLRQYVDALCKKKGIKCRCIRCREVGRAIKLENVEITVTEYAASKGKEFFIAAEDLKNDVIIGFARLRFPARYIRKEITPKSALLRELHVYGDVAQIGEKTQHKSQHKGYGKKLLAKAEEICRKHEKNKLVIISGIGVREYYKKAGYHLEGPYMTKML